MKFLCLAYGDEDGWRTLKDSEKKEVLARDAVIKNKGNLMSAVEPTVVCVRNWDHHLEVTAAPYALHTLPLAGFSVIEANTPNEVVDLVANTPCARARGVIEIHPLWDLGA